METLSKAKSRSRYFYNYYNGGDFIDIGAYEGIYSFLLAPKAKLNDTFVSCEPNTKEKQVLTENLNILKRHFKKLKFVIEFNPVGDGNDVIETPTLYGHPVFTKKIKIILMKLMEASQLNQFLLIKLVRINNLKPKFIKIDVEGAEFGGPSRYD